MWQHATGEVGNVIWVLYQISYTFQQCKNSENRLRCDKVTDDEKVRTFFETQCISIHNHTKLTTFQIFRGLLYAPFLPFRAKFGMRYYICGLCLPVLVKFYLDRFKAKFHYARWFKAGLKLVADRFEAGR